MLSAIDTFFRSQEIESIFGSKGNKDVERSEDSYRRRRAVSCMNEGDRDHSLGQGAFRGVDSSETK
jgi:hypothetical protein